jgi:tetratricopeptide (TPR) repeat protein
MNQTASPSFAQSQTVNIGVNECAVADAVKSAVSEQFDVLIQMIQGEFCQGFAQVTGLIGGVSIPAPPPTSQAAEPVDDAHAVGLFAAAYGLAKSGKREEAVSNYYAAIQVKPDFALAHSNLGLLLQDKGDTVGAMDHLRRAVELAPNQRLLRVNLAFALIRQQEFDAAFEELRAASELPAEDVRIEYSLRVDFLGVSAKGAEEINRAATTAPPFPCALAVAAQCYAERGELDRAQFLLDAAFREDPGNLIASVNQTGVYLARHDIAAANARVQAMLAADPNSALARSGLAIVALERGQYEAALKLANEALSLNDELPLAQSIQATALFRLGRYAEAVAAWRRAISLGPSDVETRVNFGLALV